MNIYLNLCSVVMPLFEQQVCETPWLQGILPHAGSVGVHWFEGLWVPPPPVAAYIWIHLHVFLHSREALNNVIKRTCLTRKEGQNKEMY